MIIDELTFPSAEEGETIYARIYLPYGEIRGILQFAHGMCDYGSRYEHFFNELTDYGYVAAYSDHLGHGGSVESDEDLGYFSAREGYQKLAEDYNTFYDILDEKFPNVKHYVMGHSMGSFVVRYFMGKYQKNMAGAILMGTSGANPFAGVGAVVAAGVALIKGGYYRSGILEHLAFGKYNRRIEDPGSDWSWLCSDDEVVAEFEQDELRNQTFTAAGFKDLFAMVRAVNSHTLIDDTPKELPILFLSGEEDPLGNYGKGILKLESTLDSMGFKDVKALLFEGARHELCMEYQAEEVFEAIGHWLNEHAYTDIELHFPEEEPDPYEYDFDDEDEEKEEKPV